MLCKVLNPVEDSLKRRTPQHKNIWDNNDPDEERPKPEIRVCVHLLEVESEEAAVYLALTS